MAYFQMFKRDYSRFEDCLDRIDVSPLGSGALAGTTYRTDRRFVAERLGICGCICENAMDGVQRQEILRWNFSATLTICMMHLSRFCEELILWSSTEFGFIEIDDAYSTGSGDHAAEKESGYGGTDPGKDGSGLWGSDHPSHADEGYCLWHIIRICRRINRRYSMRRNSFHPVSISFADMLDTIVR